MNEPGDYQTDDKYVFTETIDAWLLKYGRTLKTKYILTILSIEVSGQRKFVMLPFDHKKEAEKIYRQAYKLFKHGSIKSASFYLTQVLENTTYEASHTN